MKRYHKKIYFAHKQKIKDFTHSLNARQFRITKHSIERVSEQLSFFKLERLLTFIKDIKLDYNSIFEYYINDNKQIEKACYRVNYTSENDIILVISKNKELITVYLNEITDNHITLNKSLYVKN